MLIGINDQYQIKQIRDITDTSLIKIEIDEMSVDYPFKNWSDTKILCYCYKQTENGISIYPYIPTNIIEKIEQDNVKILEQKEQLAITNSTVDSILIDIIPSLMA